jgi:hypothetical protein
MGSRANHAMKNLALEIDGFEAAALPGIRPISSLQRLPSRAKLSTGSNAMDQGNEMSMSRQLDLSPGMPGGVGAVPLQDSVARVLSFCTHPRSGWHTYDRLGAAARHRGHFDEIAPWSLLWASTLAGRISVADIAGFTHERRAEVLRRLRALPAKDLASMDDAEVGTVSYLCRYGFRGAWAPKMTKMLALYRPDAIPVLDGHVATAMGFNRNGFSSGTEPRWRRIHQTLMAYRRILSQQKAELTQVRQEVSRAVPDIREATDLRLLDIIIWTSQDDRMSRPGSPCNYWLDRGEQEYRPACLDPEVLNETRNDE